MTALRYWIVFCSLIWPFYANGQLIDLTVNVVGSTSNEPLEGASVELLKTKIATYTDKEGKAELLKLREGRYELVVRYVGYLAYRSKLTIDQDTALSIVLREFPATLEEVTVTAQNSPMEPSSGAISLTQRELKQVPSIGGEHDINRILAITPGVKLDNEGSAGLYVRGGSSDQNLYLINQVPLYKYSHFFGFLSPINSDIVQQLNFYKSGFPARFGGRVSSVLDLTMRSASLQQLKVQGSIGILSSRLLAEIPIVRDRVSLLVAARRSYFDIFTRFFQGSGTTSGPAYTFYDANANLKVRLGQQSNLDVFTYQGQDRLTAGATNDLENFQYDQRWISRVIGAKLTSSLNRWLINKAEINLSNYGLTQQTDQQQQSIATKYWFANKLSTITLRNTLVWAPSTAYMVRAGGSYVRYGFQPGNLTFEGQKQYTNASLDSSSILEASGFAENEFRFKCISGNIGIRLASYRIQDKQYTFAEPRLLIQYAVLPSASIKATYSRMNQVIHLLTNPGFGIPFDLWFPSKGVIQPQTSNQITVAYSQDIKQQNNSFLSVSLEGYYKTLDRIVAYRDGYSSQDFTLFTQNNTRRWEDIITVGNGVSYGAELLIQKKAGRLTGWFGYTLSWTKNQFDELNNGKAFFARQDRRHDLSIVVSYPLNKRWTVNGNWIYQSGQPITLPQAVYAEPAYDFFADKFSTYSANLFVYGDRNSYRMRPTHRLDISFQRKMTHKWGIGQLELSVYNVYNRQNPYFYYLTLGNQVRAVSLFQLIPSVSYSFNIYTGRK